jgi:hypothetical protein
MRVSRGSLFMPREYGRACLASSIKVQFAIEGFSIAPTYAKSGVTDRLGTGDLCLTTGALLTHLSYRHHEGVEASAFGVWLGVVSTLPDAPTLESPGWFRQRGSL